MIAELICVGTELLMGQVLNTNAHFIAKELAPSGIDMYHQIVVGDNPKRLTEAIETALSRADVVLLSGGLGPTDDDLTKETAAKVMGKELVLYEDEWKKIVSYFESKGRTVAPNNKKQAMFPADAIILENPKGTAPGCIMEANGKAAILMPGPPRELQPMFANLVLPRLLEKAGHRLYSRELRIFGMGESDVTYRLDDLIKHQTNLTIAPYAKTGEVTLRVTARCKDDAEGEALVAPMIETIKATLGDVVYDTNGRELAEVCHHALIEAGKTLAVSESCTGGRLADAFINYPGSSAYFIEGDVTYSNDAKMRRLGVRKETLDTVGAVSEECAREMAEGTRKAAGTDFALSTTGYAGPDGGEPDKPVGTVFIALASADGTTVKRLNLFGDRDRIRHSAMLNALDLLRRKLCTK
ncbi:MAG: competence/damage-inducible protein A [Clostridia bacterium]|nr:competence/damage-inducible protein A [Clostridia bacterium]